MGASIWVKRSCPLITHGCIMLCEMCLPLVVAFTDVSYIYLSYECNIERKLFIVTTIVLWTGAFENGKAFGCFLFKIMGLYINMASVAIYPTSIYLF